MYLFYGQEDYIIEKTTKEIISAVFVDSDRSFNLDIFSGSDSDAPAVVAVANAYPFMSERRVVVIKEAQKIYNKEPIPSYILKPSIQTILILCAGEIKPKTKKPPVKEEKIKSKVNVADYLTEKNWAVQFRSMKDSDAAAWIQEEFDRAGKKCLPAAAKMLVEMKGNSSRELSIEMEKIVIAMGDNTSISEEDILSLCGVSRQYNIFELSNRVGQRDKYTSQEILYRLLEAGEQPVGLVGALTRHFINLWKVKSQSAQRTGKGKSVATFDWQRDRLLQESKNFSAHELQRCFDLLLEADLVLKSQSNDESVVMTRLIHGLVSVRV